MSEQLSTTQSATTSANTKGPRNVIYYNDNSIPLEHIKQLPYTDVIIGFLIPQNGDNPSSLKLDNGLNNLKPAIKTLQDAGKNVLIAVGGATGFSTNAYKKAASNVEPLVNAIAHFVTENGFNGVDIDFEDEKGFSGSYDGVGFLVELTKGLAKKLPTGHNIITHAPQTPFWSADFHKAPYTRMWKETGEHITWINNQFYNNPDFDKNAKLKVEWYEKIADITGAEKLMMGALVAETRTDTGFLPVQQIVNDVIKPLQAKYGSKFGGVMGWELALDKDASWGKETGKAIHLKND
jgi:chitinase